ncbi:MAG: cobalamin B12-binding domain-containing protein [Paracoccaceae bacterium]
MSDDPKNPIPANENDYLSVQARMRALKSRLPEPSVVKLAREVIRQLVEDGSKHGAEAPDGEQIADLCTALISEDDQAGARYINEVRSQGTSIEALYLGYLAGAARLLGAWWEDDRVSFTQVTVGTSRMYAIMRSLRSEAPRALHGKHRSAVFATVPGEEHTLGVRMAADLFRKDGWDIVLLLGMSHEVLVSDICASDMVLIGLSASGERALEALSKLIIALRIKKPNLRIFVSGQIVEDYEETVSLMDIDGMATEYDTAKRMLEDHAAQLSAA